MPSRPPSPFPPPLSAAAWLTHARRVALILFAGLVVFAARAQWVGTYGSPMPYWDEVSAELVPIAERSGAWPTTAELTAPHNEHRILWQRLLATILVGANDMTWDSQVRGQVNALITALAALLLALALRGRMRGAEGHLLFWPILLLSALPIAHANLLFSFQTSFHLQMLLSFGALIGLAPGNPRRASWWGGLLCGLAVLFTNGSGFFVAPVLLAWMVLHWLRENQTQNRSFAAPPSGARWRAMLPNFAAIAAILIPGLLLIHRPEGTARQVADGPSEFLADFIQHLAWPRPELVWLGPLIWAPSAILAWLLLRGHGSREWLPSARVALTITGWVLLNLAAMAWARGSGAFGPLPRYIDFHLVGLVGNAACLVLVWHLAKSSRKQVIRRAASLAALLWLSFSTLSTARLATESWQVEMPEFAGFQALQQENVARFTAGGDPKALDGEFSRFHLPYVNAESLRAWLSDPAVVELLPPHLRPANAEVAARAEATGTCALSELPPGISPPPGHLHWVSSFHLGEEQTGEYRTGPIVPRSDRMTIHYLGMPTGGALKLELIAEEGGRRIPFLATRRHGTSVWQPLTVEVIPGRAYRLEYLDRSQNGWSAFTLPVDDPPLSHLARQVHSATPVLLILGLIGIAVLLALPGTRRSGAVS